MEATCPECGRPIGPNAVEGLCPECLIRIGIGIGSHAGTDSAQAPHEASRFTPPTPEELAPRFPQLEIIDLLGKGGMGAVYRARQKGLNRVVALKVLPPQIARDPAFAERFTREAQALARLNHPNIVTVHEFGVAGEFYFFVMEFMEGVNLRQLLRTRQLSPREAMAIVPQICDALQYAHDQGIVHRDIKPENILLDRRGRVKVADFGLARLIDVAQASLPAGSQSIPALSSESPEAGCSLNPQAGMPAPQEALTDPGRLMGTPQYMAPEQFEKPMEVDHRADIFSLGVVFYEMLTGELPTRQLAPPSQKVQVDVRLDEIVLRALAQKPELRYQQASAFRTQVQTVAESANPNHPATTPAPGRHSDSSRPGAPSRWRSVASTAFNVFLAALLALAGWTAYELGIFFNALFVFILVMIPLRIGVILSRLYYSSLEHRLWRIPFARELRPYRWQAVNGWLFWLVAGLVLEMCIVPAQFSPQEYLVIRSLAWGGIAVLILLELLPGKRVHPATNAVFALASLFMLAELARVQWPGSPSDGVVLTAPVRGEWLVVNGGCSRLVNIHYSFDNQANALDVERIVDGRERTGDPNQLESYPSWGEMLYAPADGTVVMAANDHEDNPIGTTDVENPAGNLITLNLGNGRFVSMAHLQKGSVLVKTGENVRAGQPLARIGNSGNTSHPHLHLQAQNEPFIFATGLEVQTYPILFRDVTAMRRGRSRTGGPFTMRRNDRIIAAPTVAEAAGAEPQTVQPTEHAEVTITVAQDGSADYTNIQAAIDAAPPMATIRIGPGRYAETLVVRKALTLIGAGWEQTVIGPTEPIPQPSVEQQREWRQRVELAGSNERRERIQEEFDATFRPPVLRIQNAGFVECFGLKITQPGLPPPGVLEDRAAVDISGSQAQLSNCAVLGAPGSGIRIANGSGVLIQKVLVAAVWNTGIRIERHGQPSRVRIIDSEFRNCHYAGIVIGREQNEVTVETCRVSGAAWHGIRYDDASPRIIGNIIHGNARSGIYASGTTTATIQNNLFLRNEMNGISCWSRNRDLIAQNTFADNLREGLSVLGASAPAIASNIFSGHTLALHQGRIADDTLTTNYFGSPIIEKNLFWNNRTNSLLWTVGPDGQPQRAEPTDTGDRSFNPRFIDLSIQNFSLAPDSPARAEGIGAADLIPFASPWPLQPEEQAIIPDANTRDSRQWKRPHQP